MPKTKIQDLIPSNLKMSTGARLRLVADIIEAEPGRWYQGWWVERRTNRAEDTPRQMAGAAKKIECGTTCCVAGWAVSLTRPSDLARTTNWTHAGSVALGLDLALGNQLFSGGIPSHTSKDRKAMVKALRQLADLPAPRTYDQAKAAGIKIPGSV